MTQRAYSVHTLDGETAIAWRGNERALAWEEHEAFEFVPENIVWEAAGIPFQQFTFLDATLESGRVVTVCSQIDDGSGHYGLFVLEAPRRDKADDARGSQSICRYRELHELPKGRIKVVKMTQDGPNAILAMTFLVGENVVTLVAGEVELTRTGKLVISAPDESILVQVNGKRPQPGAEA